jgi:hypothetical protein
VSKCRHRLCLVTVVLALFDQAAREGDRIQESAGFGLRTPVLLYSVSSSAWQEYGRTAVTITDPTSAMPAPVEMPMPDVSGREIRKNGLRF